jgi:hypothetical protein
MSKLGDEYQELVGLVQKVLDPGATVKVGQWVQGPDGRRDIDVEVKGIVDGKDKFILVECKDWQDPIGIKEIDALDSKRHDLGADETIIYSNSGFTKDALRKAERKKIGACSALKAGDKRIKIVFFKDIVAKRLSIDTWLPVIYFDKTNPQKFEDEWDIKDFTHNGHSVRNWISNKSKQLLIDNENCERIVANYAFGKEIAFEYRGRVVKLIGIGFQLACSKKWLSQRINVDISTGLYDHINKKHIIPNEQSYMLGWIDQDAWDEMEEPDNTDADEDGININLTLINSIPELDDIEAAKLEPVIKEIEERCVDNSADTSLNKDAP